MRVFDDWLIFDVEVQLGTISRPVSLPSSQYEEKRRHTELVIMIVYGRSYRVALSPKLAFSLEALLSDSRRASPERRLYRDWVVPLATGAGDCSPRFLRFQPRLFKRIFRFECSVRYRN